MPVELTPTQSRIMNLLSDGRPHTADELHRCFSDELTEKDNVRCMVSLMRDRLNLNGLDITSRRKSSRTTYRLVRLINNGAE